MAFIIKANQALDKQPLTPTGKGGKFSLKDLQTAVGGYIEAVPGTNHRAYCDEEGRLKNKPLNVEASRMFNQVLVGDVVVLEKGDRTGGN